MIQLQQDEVKRLRPPQKPRRGHAPGHGVNGQGGQTPGMKSWRTFLVACDGGEVNLNRATRRFFAAMLSWALLGAGFLWLLLDPQRRSLHDHLSGTCLQVRKPTKR